MKLSDHSLVLASRSVYGGLDGRKHPEGLRDTDGLRGRHSQESPLELVLRKKACSVWRFPGQGLAEGCLVPACENGLCRVRSTHKVRPGGGRAPKAVSMAGGPRKECLGGPAVRPGRGMTQP